MRTIVIDYDGEECLAHMLWILNEDGQTVQRINMKQTISFILRELERIHGSFQFDEVRIRQVKKSKYE